jgi:excinuclease ABC subunit A
VLQVKCRGLNIAEVLNLTAQQAFGYCRGLAKTQRRLAELREVGLDYVRLGQPISQLSFGERKRLRLADCLAQRTAARTLIVLEEPTVGLHQLDVAKLLTLFDSLIATGYRLLVIDNHPKLADRADQYLDLTRR